MSHYYLVSSLLRLVMGQPLPLDTEAFRFQCMGALNEEEHADLTAILDGRPEVCTTGFGRRWFGVETQFCNAIARARASHYSVDAKNFIRSHPGFSVYVENTVTDAYSQGNPFDMEWHIDRGRWKMAEELSSENPFSIDGVLAYAVQLRVAARWAAVDKKIGREKLEAYIDASLEQTASQA